MWRGSTTQWTTGPNSNEDHFQENWNVIYNIYPIVTSIPGLLVKVDLGNEYTVEQDDQPERYESGFYGNVLYHKFWGKRARYTYSIWANFVGTFGKNNTVGFSFEVGGSIYDDTNRPENQPAIEGKWINRKIKGAFYLYNAIYGPPYLLSFHLYDGTRGLSACQLLQAAHNSLNTWHPTVGIIIGEAWYNDAPTASGLNTCGVPRTIWYLTQWFYTRTGAPYDNGPTAVDTNGGPYLFDNYRVNGF